MQISSSNASSAWATAWAGNGASQRSQRANGGQSADGQGFNLAAAQGSGGPPPGGPPPGPPPDAAGGSSGANNGSGYGSGYGSGTGSTQGLSTMALAGRSGGGGGGGGMGGPGRAEQGPRQDPIAALDQDGDDSVSAEEFGLDGADEATQQFFNAIDSDGSGALSSDEIGAMRDKMVAAMDSARAGVASGAGSTEGSDSDPLNVEMAGVSGAGGARGPHGPHGAGGPPPGPPPSGASDEEDGDSSDSSGTSSTSGTSTSDSAQTRAQALLAKLAQHYVSLSSDEATASFFTAEA